MVGAEYARYYWETQWVYLKGDVVARWRGDTMEAELAEFDLENLVGWLRDGRIFLADAELFIEGDDLRKTGPNTYAFSWATVTSCEGEPPAWSLLLPRGRGRDRRLRPPPGARFRVMDAPWSTAPISCSPSRPPGRAAS
jgi:LPS-assembly protein